MTPATLLRSTIAAGAVAWDTLLLAPTALGLGALLGPTHPAVSRCYREYARLALLGCGARVVSNGDAHLPAGEHFVLVANHQSHLDAPAILWALERHPVRFVAKGELGAVPLFGAALRATGNVLVTRSDSGVDVARLEAAREGIPNRVSLLFFAEGSRSAGGELRPFKRGAAAFALRARLRPVPLGVWGSGEILPPGLEVRRGGCIGVAVGDPLPIAGRSLEERGALTEELREAVAAQVERARSLART